MPYQDCNAPIPLTREELLDQDRRRLMLEAYPWMKAWSDEELDRSLAQTMSKHPEGADVWVFAYGSLIWNPDLRLCRAAYRPYPGLSPPVLPARRHGARDAGVSGPVPGAWTGAGSAAESFSGFPPPRPIMN